MNYLSEHKALLFLFVVQALTLSPSVANRSLNLLSGQSLCTPSCRKSSATKNIYDSACSCTSSCLIYNDCCRDALFQNKGDAMQKLGCVLLSGLGGVSVVNSCQPSASKSLSKACAQYDTSKVPVTSKDTGTSYSNRYCALCNNEKSSNLFEWPVQFRCCDGNKEMAKRSISEHVEHNRRKKNERSAEIGSMVSPCECKFYAESDDLTFTKSLELRECNSEEDVSSCSASWNIETTRNLCRAYLDPIYSADKVYRNWHCAICNHQKSRDLKCSTLEISSLRSDNYSETRKGRSAPISFIDIIGRPKLCISKGRRCCRGERFDFMRKKCRRLRKLN